jgi:hypothetical protein
MCLEITVHKQPIPHIQFSSLRIFILLPSLDGMMGDPRSADLLHKANKGEEASV